MASSQPSPGPIPPASSFEVPVPSSPRPEAAILQQSAQRSTQPMVPPTVQSLRRMVRQEASCLLSAAEGLDAASLDAAKRTADCTGAVIVTGVGKAGLVGQKLVATLGSTGTPAHFLHPCEAVHGDLGRVNAGDLVWALSNSGNSEEVVRIAESLRAMSGQMIAITATADNPLAKVADLSITIGRHREIDQDNLAPTSSTTVMMAVGDAIAVTASSMRGFGRREFAKFHPGGSLGRQLQTAAELMRRPGRCRFAAADATVRDAVTTVTEAGRCTGAVMIVDGDRLLRGIFTDSDLARLLARDDSAALSDPIEKHMTAPCRHVAAGASRGEVVAIMQRHRLSELPVVDDGGRVIGLIDRTDMDLDDQPVDAHQPPRPRLQVVDASRQVDLRENV